MTEGLGVRRFDRFFPTRQDELCQDRQGNWKRAWPCHVKGKKKTGKRCVPSQTSLVNSQVKKGGKTCGQKECNRWQKNREVLTPPREKVREEVEEILNGVRTVPTKFPPTTMRVGDVPVQIKGPPQRKQPQLVKHDAGVWEAASTVSDAGRATPPTRMLIRNEDAAHMTMLRIPLGRLAKAESCHVVVREAMYETMYMNWESWDWTWWFEHFKVGIFFCAPGSSLLDSAR